MSKYLDAKINKVARFIDERNAKNMPASAGTFSNSPEMYSGDPEPEESVFISIDVRPEDRGKVRVGINVFGADKKDNHKNIILLNSEQVESLAAFFGAMVDTY